MCAPKHDNKPYITTMSSMGGPKAVMMSYSKELGAYEPWMTGPGMKTPKQARAYAESWAKAEEIECK